jgi:penicillin-binding protein 2
MTRLRLGVLGIVVVSLFAVMFARLWYLQVLAAPQYQTIAQNSHIRFVEQEAPRGRILDRRGRVLVDNRVSNVVELNRALVTDRDQVLARLSALLGKPVADLQKRLTDPRFSPYKPIPLAEDVPKATVVYVREHQELFPGVTATQVAERDYPEGTLAAHLLGYVGEINDQELAARRGEGLKLGDTVGKTGVEKVYDRWLRGQPGIEKLEVDSAGKVLRTLGQRPPQQGDDLVLSVDLDVQRLAEESLAQGLAAARATFDHSTGRRFAAPGGAVVVLDPRDGSVLALASNPTYDPATFLKPVTPADYAAKFQDPATNYPLNDRGTQGQYAPGSTFKLVTAVAGLHAGLITPATTVVDQGVFRVPACHGERCTFRNAGGHSYGPVSLPRAITVSSDVYFYTMGAAFWSHRSQYGNAIQDTARSFGLGQSTGFPVGPEADGRIPDPESRKRDHELHPTLFPESRWFVGDNVNLAIGQGETLVTPLQLANAYAAFANGGTLYQPRVATAVDDQRGHPLESFGTAVDGHVALPPEIRSPIMAGFVGAVNDPKGTANAAFAGFPSNRLLVAGKTGTAQVVAKQDTALFVAMAPASAPEYVVAVVMEQSGFGGEAAAPVARRILEGIAGNPSPPAVTRGAGVD